MIDVVIADDQALVRAGFRALVDAQDDMTVVGEAADGPAAVEVCRQHRPAVVLMDIRMPGGDGLTATAQIAADETLLGTRVLVLTTFSLDEYVFEALRSGASGFLLKDTDPGRLLDGIRVVAAGDALLAPEITRRLIAEYAARAKRPTPAASLAVLTEREREILALVGTGLSNDEIAAHLTLSPATAKTHVSRVMTKLAVRDRAGLVVLAYETGLVRPGWA